MAYRVIQPWKNVEKWKFRLTFGLERTIRKGPFDFLFVSLLQNLHTSQGLYLPYLDLVEYILVPHVHRILEYV